MTNNPFDESAYVDQKDLKNVKLPKQVKGKLEFQHTPPNKKDPSEEGSNPQQPGKDLPYSIPREAIKAILTANAGRIPERLEHDLDAIMELLNHQKPTQGSDLVSDDRAVSADVTNPPKAPPTLIPGSFIDHPDPPTQIREAEQPKITFGSRALGDDYDFSDLPPEVQKKFLNGELEENKMDVRITTYLDCPKCGGKGMFEVHKALSYTSPSNMKFDECEECGYAVIYALNEKTGVIHIIQDQVTGLANTSPNTNTDLSNPQEQRIAEYKQLLSEWPSRKRTDNDHEPTRQYLEGFNTALDQCRAIIQAKIKEME